MQLKKNPKADLTKNSSLYFAIGLARGSLVLVASDRMEDVRKISFRLSSA